MKSQINHLHTTTAATNNLHSATTSLKEDRMKQQSSVTLKLAAFFAMIVAVVLSAMPASAQSSWPYINPNQVATLRWYAANAAPTTLSVSGSGTSPIAFDGTNLWVASVNDGHLNEFTTDGNPIGATITLENGSGWPVGMAFDGKNLWITEFYNKSVDRVNVNTRAVTKFTTGNSPYFDAFDGTYIWVVNHGDNTVSALNSAGSIVRTVATMSGPTGIAYDGRCLWVADTDANYVNVFSGATNACPLNGRSFPVGQSQPFGVAYDGSNIWVSYRGPGGAGPGGVVQLNDSTGAVMHTLGCSAAGAGTGSVAFDGAYIWVAGGSNGVCKYQSSLWSSPGLIGKYTAGGSASQLAFDGANMWSSLGGALVGKF